MLIVRVLGAWDLRIRRAPGTSMVAAAGFRERRVWVSDGQVAWRTNGQARTQRTQPRLVGWHTSQGGKARTHHCRGDC